MACLLVWLRCTYPDEAAPIYAYSTCIYIWVYSYGFVVHIPMRRIFPAWGQGHATWVRFRVIRTYIMGYIMVHMNTQPEIGDRPRQGQGEDKGWGQG